MAVQSLPPSLLGRLRRQALLFLAVLLFLVATSPSSARPAESPSTTTTPPPPADGEDHKKRSTITWPSEEFYLLTGRMTLEVMLNGSVISTAEQASKHGRMMLSTTFPNSENTDFAKTSRPMGLGPHDNWIKNMNTTVNFVVVIKAILSGHYVCMNYRGKVYTTKNRTADCYWNEEHLPPYKLYSSYLYHGNKPPRRSRSRDRGSSRNGNKHRHGSHSSTDGSSSSVHSESTETRGKPWYLGLNKKGVMKGYKTKQSSRDVRFLPKSWQEHESSSSRDTIQTPTPKPKRITPRTPEPPNVDCGPFEGCEATPPGRKPRRKCNNMFVFPLLEGCKRKSRRKGGRRRTSKKQSGSRQRTKKPRERHRGGVGGFLGQ